MIVSSQFSCRKANLHSVSQTSLYVSNTNHKQKPLKSRTTKLKPAAFHSCEIIQHTHHHALKSFSSTIPLPFQNCPSSVPKHHLEICVTIVALLCMHISASTLPSICTTLGFRVHVSTHLLNEFPFYCSVWDPVSVWKQ